MSKRPLRIGVMLDSTTVPAWVHAVIGGIHKGESGRVELLIMNAGSVAPAGVLGSKLPYSLYEVYSRLDIRAARSHPDAFARMSLEPLSSDVAQLHVSPRRTKFSDFIEGADLERIEAANLDVILRFGFRILRGGVLSSARHGVWSYHHGDPDRVRGGPPGFWEVMLDMPFTGVVLQRLTEDLDGGPIIGRLTVPTNATSVRRNKNHLYWAAVPLVARALEKAESEQTEAVGDPAPYDRPLYRKPRNAEFAPLLGRYAVRTGGRKLRALSTRSEWFVACRLGQEVADRAEPLYRFRELPNPEGCYWADPFPVIVDDEPWIMVEEYSFADRRGHIAALQIDESGAVSDHLTALRCPEHLSYPNTFWWSGQLWMTPESAERATVDLYRCHRFPDDWRLEATLLDGVGAVDPTLWHSGGLWFMFAGIAAPNAGPANDELHLFVAPELTGPWEVHPSNPIVSDARRSRPAGQLFEVDGNLFRPGQDCTGRYGRAISISKVTALSPDAYNEEPVAGIEPTWANEILATHTINQAGPLLAVDGMRKRFALRS